MPLRLVQGVTLSAGYRSQPSTACLPDEAWTSASHKIKQTIFRAPLNRFESNVRCCSDRSILHTRVTESRSGIGDYGLDPMKQSKTEPGTRDHMIHHAILHP
jgi:hypothetical protein